ncbi:hypothetical protein ACFCX7_25815 [Streptomyces microflavus]|uniref:LexA family protein n=1 Tax=Streptomyces microflavus TaxID=1919 RepID=UPI0035DDEA5B
MRSGPPLRAVRLRPGWSSGSGPPPTGRRSRRETRETPVGPAGSDHAADPVLDHRARRRPTIRQIGASVGLSSTSSVAYQLGQLEKRGLISRTGRDWSSCRLEPPKPPRRGLRSN